jgi:hypothetical protein
VEGCAGPESNALVIQLKRRGKNLGSDLNCLLERVVLLDVYKDRSILRASLRRAKDSDHLKQSRSCGKSSVLRRSLTWERSGRNSRRGHFEFEVERKR